ncbi:glycogen debranching protein GlgX [Paracraurococcus ruber]|uniref:Glycogen debranching enzyme GlgX n=1 Tax=Paracraurococcus ruber TaxID=77675 RepID=A0ABS1CSF4_9PROT|nr:glycogen debranching protein GlgX [Paracraurococcus ruber]MBK1657383.1 glycogen debranching enzyme GlgX [Paracraurococcus ruber]TDG32402.1 glycogen debranching enzyme GlgX [Paracraurococcus ruber]
MPDLLEGRSEPLGVVAEGAGVNVAVVAPDAWAVDFCLFHPGSDAEIACHRLPLRSGDVWHGWVPGVGPGAHYGLRAHGPWEPEAGHRFDPAKLLLDPWATRIDRPFRLDARMFGRGVDSAPCMPKAVVPFPAMPAPPIPIAPGPRVIYELHVRGFTRLHPEIPEAVRGTFAALGHPAAIAHLRALGVTHVELMPVAAGIDERHLPPLGLNNHWNYNPVGVLAPDPRLAPGGMAEIRAAVAALRAAGIGVILDVVYNHSGEGDEHGPTLSLRGLANAAFHRIGPDGRYANDAGCGNTLALDRPWPLRLAMDAMRHWVLQAGVEGFRLDLAPVLGRRADGFDPDAPLLQAMRQDPVLRERLIIAEPWDIGWGGYRLGEFPPGWGEWNDRFRDTVRRFWRGDAGQVADLATRLAGSADLFGPARRRVTDSVNYVTAHDGFTLADLVAFTRKRNEGNGEHGHDGHNENHSWNCGVEGPTRDPAVLARRAGDVRALLATLLAARGTPMLSMGDECGRTQGGNNNAYAQDNPVSWLDWAGMDMDLMGFAARLVAARLAHPALHGDAALTGLPLDDSGLPDVAWLRPDGAAMGPADWADPAGCALVMALYVPARGVRPADRVLLALNGAAHAVTLAPPAARPGFAWRILADSADPAAQGSAPAAPRLPPRSVLLLAETAAA